MSGVWIFQKNGVARLVQNPTKESFEHGESTCRGCATAPGARRKYLVYLPCNQVINSNEELEKRLGEVGWKPYLSLESDPEFIQFHRSNDSIDLISVPRNFANFKTFYMYDIVVKNSSFFEVRDHP